ncbi:hypothetical protein ACIP6U_37220, partial [Streptomyces sp. NPDC088794]
MRGVVLITGVMAAGKSTVAQAPAERLPRAAHVRGDVFRRMIVTGREEYEPGTQGGGEAQLRLRYRLSVAQALAERLPRAAHVRGDVFRRMIVTGREEYEPGTR